MPLHVERVVDGGVRLEKTLSRSPALEALHLSLASSDREVRVFGAVVVAQPAWMVAIDQSEMF